jgi:hypothetical protein
MRTLPLSLLVLSLSTVLGACLMTDDPNPDTPATRSSEALVGASYEISGAFEPSEEQIHAIAQFVESHGQDVAKNKVEVRIEGPGEATTLEIELWAAQLPGDELAAALQQEFPALADAQISVSALDPEALSQPAALDIEPGDDPEAIEEKIIADLRAQGVEGEIEVTVTPTDDGRHEIEVEVHEEQPPG